MLSKSSMELVLHICRKTSQKDLITMGITLDQVYITLVKPSIKGAVSTSIYYNAICDWNGLPDSVKGCKKIGEYKKFVKIFLTECNLSKESSSFAYF